eukprot:5148984-Prymnesium_polylepis.2
MVAFGVDGGVKANAAARGSRVSIFQPRCSDPNPDASYSHLAAFLGRRVRGQRLLTALKCSNLQVYDAWYYANLCALGRIFQSATKQWNSSHQTRVHGARNV